jgi:hypothetical protein
VDQNWSENGCDKETYLLQTEANRSPADLKIQALHRMYMRTKKDVSKETFPPRSLQYDETDETHRISSPIKVCDQALQEETYSAGQEI